MNTTAKAKSVQSPYRSQIRLVIRLSHLRLCFSRQDAPHVSKGKDTRRAVRKAFHRREKICTSCRISKRVETEFYPAQDGREGYGAWCKVCMRQKRANWEKENSAHRRDWKQTYWSDHLVQLRAMQLRGYLKQKANPVAWGRRKKTVAKASGVWNKKNPLTRAEYTSKRRTLKRGAKIVEKVRRKIVFTRDTWICQLCMTPVNKSAKWPHLDSATIDHIIPLSVGGDESYANCVTAHLKCNSQKGNRTVPQQMRLF